MSPIAIFFIMTLAPVAAQSSTTTAAPATTTTAPATTTTAPATTTTAPGTTTTTPATTTTAPATTTTTPARTTTTPATTTTTAPTATTTTTAGTTTTTATTTTTTAPPTTTKEPSYPGVLPKGTNTVCKNNTGMTDALRTHFLDTHNYRRSILAQGNVTRPSGNNLPKGADILKLRYNCKLEKAAIEEVRQCPTSKKAGGTYGKNFDTFPSSTTTPTYRDAIKKAVTDWWKVVRHDSQGPGMAVTFRQKHVGTAIESFTQMAWSRTKNLGCAVSTCSSSYTVICLYDPKGNKVEQVLYKTGTPCTACPSGTSCDNSLKLCV